jgi:hypothetical protein
MLGAHVDGVYFQHIGFDRYQVQEAMDKLLYPSGKPMFHIKDEPIQKVPTWEANWLPGLAPRTEGPRTFEMVSPDKDWRIVDERIYPRDEAQERLAKMIVDNGGGRIRAPGGAGKSYMVPMLRRLIKEQDPNARVLVMTIKHAVKALHEDGKTIAHAKHKYHMAQNCWAIIDEDSEVGLSLWADLACWKFTGWKFIIMGDADGQLLPIFDRWSDSMRARDFYTSRFLYDLVNGLQCELKICRRLEPGQEEHFELIQSLYDKPYFKPGHPDDPKLFKQVLHDTVAELLLKFPPFEGIPDCAAVMSHQQRIAVNCLMNRVMKDAAGKKTFVKWTGWKAGDKRNVTMQPQSAWFWVGQEVVACTQGLYRDHNVTNGFIYTIQDFDEDGVQLLMHTDYCKNLLAKQQAVAEALQPFLWAVYERVGVGEVVINRFSEWMNKTFMDNLRREKKVDKGLSNKEVLQMMGFIVEGNKVRAAVEEEQPEEEVLENDVLPDEPEMQVGPREFKLPWCDFMKVMRLTHALPYCYYQGRTLRDKKFLLMSTKSPHFDMRHLIVGLGRVTRGDMVSIAHPAYEREILDMARIQMLEPDPVDEPEAENLEDEDQSEGEPDWDEGEF